MEIQSETLAEEEIAAITGYMIPSGQIAWLNRNGWKYVLTRARRPVVGRVYARMKLAGVKPSAEIVAAEAWSLYMSKVGYIDASNKGGYQGPAAANDSARAHAERR